MTAALAGIRPFPVEEYESRWEHVRAKMEEHRLDLLLVTSPADLYWLSGYDSFGGYQFQAAFFKHDLATPVLLVHEMEEAGSRATSVTDTVHTWSHSTGIARGATLGDPVASASSIIRQLVGAGSRIGIPLDSLNLNAAHMRRLESLVARASWHDTSTMISELRVRKSTRELAKVRQAATFADAAMEACLAAVDVGVSELELLSTVQSTLNSLGSGYPAMPPIILSGGRTILGHQPPSNRQICDGDVVVVETIGVVDRYHANVARTAVVGKQPPLVHEAAAVAAETLLACTQAARPGVAGAELDLLSKKLASRFPGTRLHRVGYGLEASYPPVMTGVLSCAEGDPRLLEPGMALSLSPHLYFRDQAAGKPFSILMGQDLIITDNGSEVLTQLPAEVKQVG